jgi:anti-sigma factor RsiW
VTCREFADFMAGYLSGEIPPDVRRRFERHLDVCENCRRYLVSYEESVKLGRRAFDEERSSLPADIPEDLVKAVLDARARRAD